VEVLVSAAVWIEYLFFGDMTLRHCVFFSPAFPGNVVILHPTTETSTIFTLEDKTSTFLETSGTE
jgi:hypothetical protein